MEIDRGSITLPCVENSLWKRLRSCRETEYITMIEVMTTWRMSKTDRSDSGATCYTVLKGCVVINLGKCATCVKISVFIEHKITTWRQHKNRL